MVDKDKILMNLKKFFHYQGSIDIDNQGLVSCRGDVQFLAGGNKLPVQFAVVEGDFRAVRRGLSTLVGAPHTVKGHFICMNNPITTLQGGPTSVYHDVYVNGCQLTNLVGAPTCTRLYVQSNPLQSLEGMPENLKVVGFTFDRHLPMLRALQAEKISMFMPDTFYPLALTCHKILNKYAGKGHTAALECAAELANLGLKENARW